MKLSEIQMKDLKVLRDGDFSSLSHCTENTLNSILTFFNNEKFIEYINTNENITSVICEENLVNLINRKSLGIAVIKDSKHAFFQIHNNLFNPKRNSKKPIIGQNCKIDKTTKIYNNVIIGDNVVIEDNVVINENVFIGSNTIIRHGSVIGGNGFEFKRNSNFSILSVNHYGKTIIGENVELKEYTTIHKAVFEWDYTFIDDFTKVDSHVHIGHATKIGKRCLIGSHCNLAGNIIVQDDVYIGLGSTITNRIIIGSSSKISLGSVVTKDVISNTTVTGNFAIPHEKFMKNLKKTI